MELRSEGFEESAKMLAGILARCIDDPGTAKFRTIKIGGHCLCHCIAIKVVSLTVLLLFTDNAKFNAFVWSVPLAHQFLLASGFQVENLSCTTKELFAPKFSWSRVGG